MPRNIEHSGPQHEAVHSYWAETGEFVVEGVKVAYGVAPPGMDVTVKPESLPGGTIVVRTETVSESGQIADALQGTFEFANMPSEGWLMADGRLVADPPC